MTCKRSSGVNELVDANRKNDTFNSESEWKESNPNRGLFDTGFAVPIAIVENTGETTGHVYYNTLDNPKTATAAAT